MNNLVELEQFVKSMAVGGMVHGRYFSAGVWRSGLFIQADPGWLARLPANPLVEMRFGMFDEKRAGLIFWMARMGGELFESWVNWSDPGGRQCVIDLAAQAEVEIHLYNRRARARSVRVSNTLAHTAEDIIVRLGDRMWSDEDFESARQGVYGRYPTPEALWAASTITGGRV